MPKKVLMCDIDGTLTVKPDDGCIDFSSSVAIPNKHIVEFLTKMCEDHVIVFFTKRSKEFYEPTRKLIENLTKGRFSFHLFTRTQEYPISYKTSDIKWDMYIHTMSKFSEYITMYIEDNLDTIKRFRENGIVTIHPSCFEVGDGQITLPIT